jgi:transcriptional regulator
MSYPPKAFRETDLAVLHEQIAGCGLAMLITQSEEGPLVSHLPLLLDRGDGPMGTLLGHVARTNPQWQASDFARPAVAVFMGPDAYVSPSWYESKRTDGRVVPTWNYVAVHARGRLEPFEDAAQLKAVVSRLTDRQEGRLAAPWHVTDAPEDFIARMLKGIVGLRLAIEALEGRRKLSQNRAEADRHGVAAALRGSADPSDQAVAALMERTQPA